MYHLVLVTVVTGVRAELCLRLHGAAGAETERRSLTGMMDESLCSINRPATSRILGEKGFDPPPTPPLGEPWDRERSWGPHVFGGLGV